MFTKEPPNDLHTLAKLVKVSPVYIGETVPAPGQVRLAGSDSTSYTSLSASESTSRTRTPQIPRQNTLVYYGDEPVVAKVSHLAAQG